MGSGWATFFMREQEHFDFFQNVILPDLVKRHQKDKVLAIWSAGCSSGEEPYNISIYIKEFLGAQASQWDTRVLATDISQKALASAKRGVYDLPDTLPPVWREKIIVRASTESSTTSTRIVLFIDHIKAVSPLSLCYISPAPETGSPLPLFLERGGSDRRKGGVLAEILRVADHEIPSGNQGVIEPPHQRVLCGLVEIDHHVPAENHVELQAEPDGVHQIEGLKDDVVPNDGRHHELLAAGHRTEVLLPPVVYE